MNETSTERGATTVDKAALRSELEAAHASYRDLVAQIPDEKWNAKSGNSGWTCGQLAWHLADGIKFSVGVIENARKGKQTNPPAFLMPLGYKANEFLVRRKSRGATRDSVLADYERYQRDLLTLLDSLRDDEFAITKTNFGDTQSVESMFRISIEHFAEHAPQIRSAL